MAAETSLTSRALGARGMQQYDVALKNVLTRGTSGFLSGLMGLEVAKFLNVDLPEARSQQADLVGEARDGTLFHVEFQSTNDTRMAFRMLNYLVTIERKYKSVPRQVVLYVGEARMKMESRIVASSLWFEASRGSVAGIDAVGWIAQPGRICERGEPGHAYFERYYGPDLFGPLLREGMAAGRVEGERALIQKQIATRFGTPPVWVGQRISQLGIEELEALGVRLFHVQSLEELFGDH